ncbi:hypothetical protein [Roseovarius sp.]|nr:hypothetical protein [Roseovarius sp.]
MSTIGYESWAVDLAEVGAIYPFQGWEMTMTVIGVIFWIGWHRIQFKRESEHLEKAKMLGDTDKITAIVERY